MPRVSRELENVYAKCLEARQVQSTVVRFALKAVARKVREEQELSVLAALLWENSLDVCRVGAGLCPS